MSDVELPVAHYKMSHVCIWLRREQQSDEYEINYFLSVYPFSHFPSKNSKHPIQHLFFIGLDAFLFMFYRGVCA